MKISIIIPIYNVEKYIERCINSVLGQTYRNLELILINDCTPDQSMDIVKRIINNSEKSKDFEIKYISHTTNKGIAATRNTGMKNVSGEYFFFLDSDDEITPDCIESMVTLAQKYKGVDLIQGDIVYTNNNKIKGIRSVDSEYVADKSLIKKMMFNDGTCTYSIPNVVWNKLIRTSLVIENNMWFKEGIVAEDVYWLIMYWKYINSIAFNLKKTYLYFNDNPSSITNEKIQKHRHFFSKMETFKDFIPTIDKNDFYIYRHYIRLLHHFGKVYRNDEKSDLYIKSYKETVTYLLTFKKLPYRVRFCLHYLLMPDFLVRIKIIDLILKS